MEATLIVAAVISLLVAMSLTLLHLYLKPKFLTQINGSYVRHYDWKETPEWTENGDNHFTGLITTDGYLAGTMINSYGLPSVLEGRIHRFLCFWMLIGRATNYPNYPEGAPYYQFSVASRHHLRGILLGQQGFVYVKLRKKYIVKK